MKLFSQIIIGLIALVIVTKILMGVFKLIIYLIKNTKEFSLKALFENYTEYVGILVDEALDNENELLSGASLCFISMGYVFIPFVSLFTGIGMWIEWAFR